MERCENLNRRIRRLLEAAEIHNSVAGACYGARAFWQLAGEHCCIGELIECRRIREQTDWLAGKHIENAAELPLLDKVFEHSMTSAKETSIPSEWKFPQTTGAENVSSVKVEQPFVEVAVARHRGEFHTNC